jgi:hypothetical protein
MDLGTFLAKTRIAFSSPEVTALKRPERMTAALRVLMIPSSVPAGGDDQPDF